MTNYHLRNFGWRRLIMIKLKELLNEASQLPPDMDKKSEIMGGFIGSFFIRYFEKRMSHIKTKSDEQIVKYAEYYRLAKQYREIGRKYFIATPTDERTIWGKATYKIRAKDDSMPPVIVKVGDGYSAPHDGYIDQTKYPREVCLYVDAHHFIKSFKKSVIDMTVTLKHEILHCIQLTDPEYGKINKMMGMAKDKVASKTADVYGNIYIDGRKIDGRLPHGMRDVEFKPNLLTYSHYIRNYLNKNYPSGEWAEIFKDIVHGNTQTHDGVVNNYSRQLYQMLCRDKIRWKQFVKELSVAIFAK